MNQILHLIEPSRLFLCWKGYKNRRKNYLVGEITRKNDELVLKYYSNSKDFLDAKQEGFIGMPAFPPDKQPEEGFSHGVKDAFLRRVPPRTRTDFHTYLENHGLARHSNLSDFALFGYTEARLPGDGFFLIHSFDQQQGPLELILEVAGVKDSGVLPSSLKESNPLTLSPDKDNKFDHDAIGVMGSNTRIGFINRCQTIALHYWIQSGCHIQASVQRINGTAENPRVFAFVVVTPPLN